MNVPKNFCKYCGAPLAPDGKFCEGCGQHINGRPETAATPATLEPPPQTLPPPQKTLPEAAPPGRKSLLPWIIGGVVIIVLGGLAGGYLSGKSKESASLPPAPATSTLALPKAGPQPVAEKSTIPASPETPKEQASGLASLPPPPPVDQQVGAEPLPPPPSLDQQDETGLPFLPPAEDQQVASSPLPEPPPVATPDLPAASGGAKTLPWTSQRPVTSEDLSQLSPRELVLMRNEIYARHGWVFGQVDLRDHFEKQPWYRPKGNLANREAANRKALAELPPLERQNVRTILKYEQSRKRLN
jgi:hypothetical protein